MCRDKQCPEYSGKCEDETEIPRVVLVLQSDKNRV